MSLIWYYSIGGNEKRGPVSAQDLAALAKSGALQKTDHIWKEGLTEWVPAGRAKGLFPADQFTSSPLPQPVPLPRAAQGVSPPLWPTTSASASPPARSSSPSNLFESERTNRPISELMNEAPNQFAKPRTVEINKSAHSTTGNMMKIFTVIAFILSFTAFLVVSTFLTIWFFTPYGIGQKIQSNCHANGLGNGSCYFTNVGWTPGADCVEVALVNLYGDRAKSGRFCSGRVWPNDTVEKSFDIVLGDTCKDKSSRDRSWTEMCSFDVEER